MYKIITLNWGCDIVLKIFILHGKLKLDLNLKKKGKSDDNFQRYI